MAESVFDLVPRAQDRLERPAMYRSRHDGTLPPFGSTLVGASARTGAAARPGATFGQPAGALAPDPRAFTRSHARDVSLPDPAAPSHPKQRRLPPVPLRTERGACGLRSDRDFVKTNAIENILLKADGADGAKTRGGAPRKPPPAPPVDWTSRKGFGRTPGYLAARRRRLADEAARVAAWRTRRDAEELEEAGVVRALEGADREALLRGLKAKWAAANAAYQRLSFSLDTPAKRSRKEDCEAELSQIEADIRRLQRGETILVVRDE